MHSRQYNTKERSLLTLLLIGPLPPPYDGMSIMFKLLAEGFMERKIGYELVDITGRLRSSHKPKPIYRLFDYLNITKIIRKKLSQHSDNTVYLTIAQSRAGFFRDWLVISCAFHYKSKIVVHLHGGNYGDFYRKQPRLIQFLIRNTMRKCSRIIILGEDLRQMFDFDPTLADKLVVVPNCLPVVLRDLPLANKVLHKKQTIKLLYLSNLIEMKGYLDVLKAVSILRKEYGIDVFCTFCGAFLTSSDDLNVRNVENARTSFFDFVNKEELHDVVSYCGVVNGQKKIDILKEAHVMVLPTNYINEGQPVSIIEAMALGCVTITTKYRAIPDMILDGVNGFFVRFGHPEDIALAVKGLVEKPDKFGEMSSHAIRIYKERFTREAHLNSIIPVIIDNNVPSNRGD